MKLFKKMNKKGYMLVEIIVASVIAIGIVYYLLDLVYKFKDVGEDLNQSYIFEKDNNLLTKNIMNDIGNHDVYIYSIDYDTEDDKNKAVIKFGLDTPINTEADCNSKECRKLVVDMDNRYIEYGKYNSSNVFNTNDTSYYKKTINDSLVIDDVVVNSKDGVVSIEIPLSSIYDDKDYSIKFLLNGQELPEPPQTPVTPQTPESESSTSCVVDVTEINTDPTTTSNNRFWGWNWMGNYTSNYKNYYSNRYGNYCNSSSGFSWYGNWMCHSSSDSATTTTNECEKKVEYDASKYKLGFTYIVKFKVTTTDDVVLFGDDSTERGFSGFRINDKGKLVVDFNGKEIESQDVIQKNRWYVIASVFGIDFSSSAKTGFSFKTSYSFYLYDGSQSCKDDKDGDNLGCVRTTEFSLGSAGASFSTSGNSFSVNNSIKDNGAVTGINVSDSLFYFRALDKKTIYDYFGSKRTSKIDISSGNATVSRPLFYFKNHPTGENYSE